MYIDTDVFKQNVVDDVSGKQHDVYISSILYINSRILYNLMRLD